MPFPSMPVVPGTGSFVAPRRALISVTEKTNLRELCEGLAALGCELYATSSTRATLEGYGLAVKSVESATGFPEILGGRVKTLHPVVFGGILARAGNAADQADLTAHGLAPFDVVVCNLYPFQDALAKLGGPSPAPDALASLIEKIDIGGVTLLRAAAKNLERVSVLCDAVDYLPFLAEAQGNGGRTTPALRARLAVKALKETAAYDAVISTTLESLLRRAGAYDGQAEAQSFTTGVGQSALVAGTVDGPVRAREGFPVSRAEASLPDVLRLEFTKVQTLRYGENPHQKAAFYAGADACAAGLLSLPALTCFHGKELSYNNVLDVEHAVRLVNELGHAPCAAVIVKHNMPCGVGLSVGPGANAAQAYARAFESDPISPFGGIVAFNATVDEDAARVLHETFLEVVVAPDFTPAAAEVLQRKKNLRLVKLDTRRPLANRWQFSHVQGGLLVQEADVGLWETTAFRSATAKPVAAAQEPAIRLAFAVVKHVRSNAIVLATDHQTIAIAGGFTNRVDAVRQVLAKARLPLAGAILASDAFFPFPDSIELLKGTGIAALVQPGGSVQDEAVVAACDAQGLAMAFTGMRHFKH